MQDAWRDNWQPRNVFPSSRPATSSLDVSLAINPLENRWPIKSCVQGEPPLINADCQGASLMYFSFKESVSNAHCFGEFSLSNVSRGGGCRDGGKLWRDLPGWRFQFYRWRYLFLLKLQKLRENKNRPECVWCADIQSNKLHVHFWRLWERAADTRMFF